MDDDDDDDEVANSLNIIKTINENNKTAIGKYSNNKKYNNYRINNRNYFYYKSKITRKMKKKN